MKNMTLALLAIMSLALAGCACAPRKVACAPQPMMGPQMPPPPPQFGRQLEK